MKNVGKKDANIRYGLALVLLLLSIFTWNTSQILSLAVLVVGVVLVVTGMIGFCGLYKVFGINTCPIDKQ